MPEAHDHVAISRLRGGIRREPRNNVIQQLAKPRQLTSRRYFSASISCVRSSSVPGRTPSAADPIYAAAGLPVHALLDSNLCFLGGLWLVRACACSLDEAVLACFLPPNSGLERPSCV